MSVSEAYFHFSADQNLSEALSDMPASVKSFLQRGFDVMARLGQPARTTLLDAGLRSLHSPQESPKDEAARFGIDLADFRAAIGAATFTILSLGGGRISADDFLTALEHGLLITPEQRTGILQFVEIIGREQARVKSTLDSISAGRAVLPGFYRVEWTVDVRVRYDRNDKAQFTVVAILRIDTDHRDDELLFQVTLPQLDYLIEDLTRLRKRMLEVDDWKNARIAT